MRSLKAPFLSVAVLFLLGVLFGCEEKVVDHKPKPQDMRIVFYSNRTDSTEVFVMDENGSNQQRISLGGLLIGPAGRGPLWSPDKEEIAFTCFLGVGGVQAIMLINPDGSGLDTLVMCDYPKNAYLGDWSPNGNQIVYRTEEVIPPAIHSKIFVINRDGAGNIELDYGLEAGFCGNNRLVYSFFEDSIFIINTHGTGKKQLADSVISGFEDVSYYLPVGSPNGEKIACGVVLPMFGPHYALGIMNSDGSGDTLLAWESGPDGITEIEFSPNGQKILFLANNGDNSEIFVINTDGTGLDSLTGGIACADGGASWSPDGDWIVFTSKITGNKDIYKVSTDGSNTFVRLTDDPADDFNPDW
jgi:WD40 repeat protein